ncbi:hypothetical protein GCM10023228_17940 [Brevibacillus fulvus]|uniref:Uncharacterized protein n=1 Tax=Brevibacillus fulvus TaxID=1125967 RepID=A0A938Y1R8_9BACL|nr:hypothetical protein [Brevibacillus fulvus]
MGKSYLVSVDASQAIFNVVILRTFLSSEYVDFLRTYNQNISTINPSEYELHVRYSKNDVRKQNIFQELKESFYHLFYRSGFKKVSFIDFSNDD